METASIVLMYMKTIWNGESIVDYTIHCLAMILFDDIQNRQVVFSHSPVRRD